MITLKRIALLISGVFLASVQSPLAQSALPQIPMVVKPYPIYAPTLDTPKYCSYTSVTVTRADGAEFTEHDIIEVAYFAKENTLGVAITSGSFTVTQDIYTYLNTRSVSVPITLCLRDLENDYVKGTISELEIRVRYFKDLTLLAGETKLKVKLLPRTEEAKSIEKLLADCDFKSKPQWNLVIEQKIANVAKGKAVTLVGTLFRNGVPSPNDTVRLYEEFKYDPSKGSVKMVAQATTDSTGSFTWSFIPKSPSGMYTATFQRRTSPIGPLHGPYGSGNVVVDVDCKSTCNYSAAGSINDWIPKYVPQCLTSFNSYDLLYASSSNIDLMYPNGPDRIAYLYRKVFPGSKGKSSYLTSYDAESGGYSSGSSGSGAKRCYVNGYTTRTGKRVSGYWRNC